MVNLKTPKANQKVSSMLKFIAVIFIFSVSLSWSSQEIKIGLYQAQSHWGDNLDGSLTWKDKKENSFTEAAPSVLNIWWVQYQLNFAAKWGLSLKTGYHFNRLEPYNQFGVSVDGADGSQLILDKHQGLEDFDASGSYQFKEFKLHLGGVMPLFQAKPNSLKGAARAWSGFRALRGTVAFEGFHLNQWWMLKTDIILKPLNNSQVHLGDGNIQLMNFWGYPITQKFGTFVGQIIQVNSYHWDNENGSSPTILRRELTWEPQVGLSLKESFFDLKVYLGATAWSFAEVKEQGDLIYEPAQASRNIILGFSLSHQW